MRAIVVGSTRPVKMKATANVLVRLLGQGTFRLAGHPAPSGVPETPTGRETLEGARNRARAVRARHEADYCIGLESGLVERFGQVFEEAWAWVIGPAGEESAGYSSGLRLPDHVLTLMRTTGQPHALVMAQLQRTHGLPVEDTWGNYSGGIIDRTVSLEEALRNALVPILVPATGLYAL